MIGCRRRFHHIKRIISRNIWCGYGRTNVNVHPVERRRGINEYTCRFMSSNVLNQNATSYNELVNDYKPTIPKYYNIGVDICDKHVSNGNGNNVAIIDNDNEYTFTKLRTLSNRLANGLKSVCHIERNDRVSIFMGQCVETALSHIAIYKLGGIVVPLFKLFGPEAIEYRLNNCRAKCIITDNDGYDILKSCTLPHLKSIVVVNTKGRHASKHAHDFYDVLISEASEICQPVPTLAEDPALIIYTSGTTGDAKGCVHAHRVLLGHLPGVEMPHNFFPQKNDRFWTPADWAWIGGLLDVLLPSLHHCIPVLAHRSSKFDANECFDIMRNYNVKNTFMPATVLRLLQKASNNQTYHGLRSLGSGGETLGDNLLEWGRTTFDVTINEFYGQTECNLILSNCSHIMDVRSGSMGRPVPGKIVEIVNNKGEIQPTNCVGDIAVKRPDLTMFLEYWEREEETRAKFRGDWLLTGDQGKRDNDGYFWFVGRDDDIICSAGYRIGPGEIEECLLKHESVALVAVIGIPDEERTEIIKAYIVLHDKDKHDENELKHELKEFVGQRLAWHEKPREIQFVNDLPMTTTGKVQRGVLRKQYLKNKTS